MAQDSERIDQLLVAVRDRRGKKWFWQDNLLYDDVRLEDGLVTTWAAILGPSAVSVYGYLCRRADEETQACFPSHPTIGFLCGLSDPVVIESLQVLEDHGLILIQHRDAVEGDATSNLYVLLPIENWSFGGGKSNLLPTAANEARVRRFDKARKKKVPFKLKEKHQSSQSALPQVVNYADHPGKQILLALGKPVDHCGRLSLPPLDQTARGEASNRQTSQQQHADAVVDASIESPAESYPAGNPEREALVAALIREGVRAESTCRGKRIAQMGACALVDWDAALCRQWLDWWPWLKQDFAESEKPIKNPGGLLAEAIRHRWPKPASLERHEQEQAEAGAQAAQQEQAQAERERQAAQWQEQVAQADEVKAALSRGQLEVLERRLRQAPGDTAALRAFEVRLLNDPQAVALLSPESYTERLSDLEFTRLSRRLDPTIHRIAQGEADLDALDGELKGYSAPQVRWIKAQVEKLLPVVREDARDGQQQRKAA
jgi:Helix-turn-helix domain